MSKINGQLGAFEQPHRYGRNESGDWSVITYEGTRDEIYDQAYAWNGQKGAIWQVEHSFTGGKDRLTVHIPWNYANFPYLDVTTEWELFAETVEKDLLELDPNEMNFPADSPLLALSYLDKSFIREALDAPSTLSDLVDSYQTEAGISGEDFSPTVAKKVFYMMQSGFKQMRVSVPKLRKTTIVNSQTEIKAGITNVGKLVTPATLTSVYELPSDLLFNLPNNAQPASFADKIEKRYGWFCHYPTVRQAALIKWHMVQEFEYGLWNYAAYGNPV